MSQFAIQLMERCDLGVPVTLAEPVKDVLRYLRENEFPVRITITTFRLVATYQADRIVWLSSNLDGMTAYRLYGGPLVVSGLVEQHRNWFGGTRGGIRTYVSNHSR